MTFKIIPYRSFQSLIYSECHKILPKTENYSISKKRQIFMKRSVIYHWYVRVYHDGSIARNLWNLAPAPVILLTHSIKFTTRHVVSNQHKSSPIRSTDNSICSSDMEGQIKNSGALLLSLLLAFTYCVQLTEGWVSFYGLLQVDWMPKNDTK